MGQRDGPHTRQNPVAAYPRRRWTFAIEANYNRGLNSVSTQIDKNAVTCVRNTNDSQTSNTSLTLALTYTLSARHGDL